MAELINLAKEAASKKPHQPNIDVYMFGQTDDLLKRLDKEGIILGRNICTTFGLLMDLDWTVTQAENDSSFLAYGVSVENHSLLDSALATIFVDYSYANRKLNIGPDVMIAGVNRTAKKMKGGDQPAIIAASYRSGYMDRLRVGVDLSDNNFRTSLSKFITQKDYSNHPPFVELPTGNENYRRTAGFITKEMVDVTHNTVAVGAAKRGERYDVGDMGQQPRPIVFPGGSQILVNGISGGTASMEYYLTSNRDVKPFWAVHVPTLLKE